MCPYARTVTEKELNRVGTQCRRTRQLVQQVKMNNFRVINEIKKLDKPRKHTTVFHKVPRGGNFDFKTYLYA